MAPRKAEKDGWNEAGPDAPANWDFDGVPDTEAIACCLWEYARESKTIGMKADLHWCHVRHIVHREEYEREPALKREHDEEAKRIEARCNREGFDDDAFAEKFWKTDFPLLSIYEAVTEYVRDGAFPWQRLPKRMRTHLAKQVDKSIVLHPLSSARVWELEELWKANFEELAAIRSKKRGKTYDREEMARWAETQPVEPRFNEQHATRREMTVAFTIDFSRFTNQEIAEAFSQWLRDSRPKKWKRPQRVFPGARRRGRKLIEYRVALERLGLMRLLHFHSPAELRRELPQAWKKIERKEQDFRREIREACKFFRRLFPFLPKDELPDSAERFAVWHARVKKFTDEGEKRKEAERGRK